MPYYDYLCETCGSFTKLMKMADFDKSCDCPSCHEPARRAFLRAPTLASMDSARRNAYTTNERAQHDPKSTKKHVQGCSCCSGGKSSNPGRTLYRADGSKSFPSARPWMISH